jgi:hypothetical protein
MDERGYRSDPDGDGGVPRDRLDMVAVDHPQQAADYRSARASSASSIDDLRVAFVRYRALFDALLADGGEARPSGRPPHPLSAGAEER